MSDSGHIKLHIPGESFWAQPLTKNTARVDNILLESSIGLGDTVSFNPETNEVIEVLVKKTNTAAISYVSSKETIKENFQKLYHHFESQGIKVEGVMPGIALMAIPVEMPDDTVDKLLNECPIKVALMFGEEGDEPA